MESSTKNESTNEKPGWLQNYVPQQGLTRPNGSRGFVPGVSGNPAGRPKGTKAKKTLIAQEFEKDGSKVARVVIDAALAGDISAANLVLQRLVPPLKVRAEKVQFELDGRAPLTYQAGQVLVAVAQGVIDPYTGQILINCISSFAGLRDC